MSYLERIKKQASGAVSKVSKGTSEPFETCQGRLISANPGDDESAAVYQVLSDLCARYATGQLPEDEFKRRFRRVETAYLHGDAGDLRRAMAEVNVDALRLADIQQYNSGLAPHRM